MTQPRRTRLRVVSSLSFVFLLLSLLVPGCDDDTTSPSESDEPEVSYSVSDSTTVLEPEDQDVVRAYDRATGTMTLDAGADVVADVSEGTILLGQDAEHAPEGFLRRVTRVRDSSGDIVVQTEPALLEEAFESLALRDSVVLRPSQIERSVLHEGVSRVLRKGDEVFEVELDCVLFDADGNHGTTGDQVRIEGSYAFDATLQADIDIAFFSLERLEVWIDTEQSVDFDVVAGLTWEFDRAQEIDLWDIRLAPIPLGGVVWLVPSLGVEAHVHGDLSVTIETGLTYTQEIRTGFGYEKGADPQFYPIEKSEQRGNFEEPSFSAELDFEAGASLNASCLLYGVAGPYMAGKTGFHFNAALGVEPCDAQLALALDATFYAVVGIEMDAYVFDFDWSREFELYTHPIHSWSRPFVSTGSIVVDAEPDDVAFPWIVEGPCDFRRTGQGDATLSELPRGEYAITWEDMSGWSTPEPLTMTVEDDETETATGVYVDEDATIGSALYFVDEMLLPISRPRTSAGTNADALQRGVTAITVDPTYTALDEVADQLTVASSQLEFERLLDEGIWDLVVLMQNYEPQEQPALVGYIEAGGAAIVTDWSRDADLAEALEISYLPAVNREPIDLIPEALAVGVTDPVPLQSPGWRFWSLAMQPRSGVVLATVDGTGDPAAVLTNGGRTAVVGWLNDTFVSDTDAQNFYRNLLTIVRTGPVPPARSWGRR